MGGGGGGGGRGGGWGGGGWERGGGGGEGGGEGEGGLHQTAPAGWYSLKVNWPQCGRLDRIHYGHRERGLCFMKSGACLCTESLLESLRHCFTQ